MNFPVPANNNFLLPAEEAEQNPEIIFEKFVSLEVAGGNASLNTVRTYKSNIKQFLKYSVDNNLRFDQVKRNDIVIYRSFLVAKYARATVANKLATVRRFFDALVAHGLILVNPAQGVKAQKENSDRATKVKWLSEQNLEKLFLLISDSRDKAIVALMARHGLRASEISSLKVEDLEGNRLLVSGKGGKKRLVALTQKTVEDLENWMYEREVLANSEYLFISYNHACRGQQLKIRGLRKIVDGYLSKAGLKREGVSCHSLRHSAATNARKNGAKLSAIQKMLGHASIKTTEIYADIVEREQDNPALFLGY